MAGIPQVITEDRASGAQVIEGSLKFDSSKTQFLEKTFASAGNRKTWTYSAWFKRGAGTSSNNMWAAYNGTFSGLDNFGQNYWPVPAGWFSLYQNGGAQYTSTARYRDHSGGWYHLVIACDVTQSSYADRYKVYVNNFLNSSSSGTIAQNTNLAFNNNIKHYIGTHDGGNELLDGNLSQVYFIDGQALGPENFGYTDPLTNTWRPKKYEGDYNIGPASGLNGVIWSNYITGTVDGTYPLSNCFGGNIGSGYTNGTRSTNPGTLTLSIASLNLNVTNVKLHTFIYNTPSTFTVNGTTVPRGSDPNGDVTFTVAVNGQLNTIAWSYDSGSGPYCYMKGIEVDLGDGAGYRLLTDGAGGPTGANSFYLPLDGKTPIGKDQSGNGNDWTPIGFGGSLELPKATGAIPILNTNDAGTVAKRGIRTDKKTYTVTASGGNYYLDGALKPTLNAYRGGSYTFDYTGATSHPFYLSSLPDGKWNSKAYSVEFDGIDDSCSIGASSDFTMGTGDFTIECFVQKDNNGHQGILQISDTAGGFTTTNYGTTLAIGYQVGVWQIYGTGNSTPSAESASYPINAGQWYHVAYVRNNGIAKLYVDGVEVISRADTYSYNGTYIGYGGYYNSSYLHQGKISNLRVVKGQALYTSNFTRPSTTLTTTSQGAIASNVKLICCQDSDAATAAVKPGNITVNGDSVARNESPFLYNTNDQEGVNTGTSNITKITIPHWAADTLYYYCNAHSGMGSSINVTTDIFKADPYAWKNFLNISLNSYAEDISDEVNFASTEQFITATGASASSAQSNFYRGSYYFDGSNTNSPHYLDLGNTAIPFNNNSWTIETWFYGTGYDGTILHTGSGWNNNQGLVVQLQSSEEKISFYQGNGSISTLHVKGIPLNVWHHLAMVGDRQNVTLYIDGVAQGTITQKNNIGGFGDDFLIGAYRDTNYQADPRYGFKGYLQEFRVYSGVAKYTENFVVGSTAPDILPDTPSGIIGKTNLAKITDGAVAFDGTGDYLSVPDSNDFDLAGNDWTIEAFVYHSSTDYASYEGIVAQWVSGSGSSRTWTLETVGSGATSDLEFYYYDTSDNFVGPVQGGKLTKNRWHHVAVCRSSNTIRIFVDGVMYGSGTTINVDIKNSTDPLWIGRVVDGYWNGHISNARVVNGTALYTTNFTPPSTTLTNVTNTKLLCCQSTTSAIAAAVTPGSITANGDVAATNFNPFTDDINTIRGQASGYATLNPLDKFNSGTLSNGNLTFTSDGNTGWDNSRATIGASKGKFYWEMTVDKINQVICASIIGPPGDDASNGARLGYLPGQTDDAGVTYYDDGRLYHADNQNAGSAWGAAYGAGDVISIALDMDDSGGKVWFAKNGIWQASGNPSTGANPARNNLKTYADTWFPVSGVYFSDTIQTFNFGQKPFKFAPPDGFQPLNFSNIQPDKVFVRPEQYVSAITYSGNNSSSNTVTDLKFNSKPDFVWIKSRSGSSSPGSQNHYLMDSVRGANGSSGTSKLYSNNSVEANSGQTATTNGVRFTHNGFELTTNNDGTNSNNNYVAWCWKAGGSEGTFNVDGATYATAAAAGLSAGTMTVTGASVGTKQGFSIVRYTGSGSQGSLAHGLGQKPTFWIIKAIDAASNGGWFCYTEQLDGSLDWMYLNSNDHKSDSGAAAPTSTTIGITSTLAEAVSWIAYVWHDVPGLQKFGSFIGNSSQNFVELGFRPAIVWVKRAIANSSSDTSTNNSAWTIMDSTRLSYNGQTPNHLYANHTADEGKRGDASGTSSLGDMTLEPHSNGFYLNGPATETNSNTGKFIYCAWAESPASNLYGGQSNAR